MAKDRRRFAPSPEGLEGRALMSGLFGGSKFSAAYNQSISAQDLPSTYRQKLNRIDHLPFYLRQADTSRVLPPDVVEQLQTDMRTVVASLHAPSTEAVDAFNAGLRHLMPYKTLSRRNAYLLNNAFGAVLERAGATPDQTAALQADMLALSQVDVTSSTPAALARQDYALVLQTTLAVGRPMQTPSAPILAATDGVRAKDNTGAVTHDHNPVMVGTYQPGATKIGYIRMQIIDANDRVLGTGVVDASGTYSIALSPALPDGTYELRSRAADEVGHLSLPSPHAFRLRVTTSPRAVTTTPTTTPPAAQTLTPPGGPLGLG